MAIILDEHGRPANGTVDQATCNHGVAFDADAAKTMSSSEVKARFPRFFGTCKLCGYSGIYYASYLHYISGDW